MASKGERSKKIVQEHGTLAPLVPLPQQQPRRQSPSPPKSEKVEPNDAAVNM
jgi:hypothetical protein